MQRNKADLLKSKTGRRRLLAVLLLGTLSVRRVHAQEADPGQPAPPPAAGVEASPSPSDHIDRPYWRQNLFRRAWSDQKFLFTTWWPSEFHRQGFVVPVVLGTVFALASGHDEDGGADLSIEREIRSDVQGRGHIVARRFSSLAEASTGAVFIGTTYLIGRWSHHDPLAEASSLSAEALLDAGLWCTVLKGVTARTRPSGGGTGDFLTYHPPSGQVNGSFPSGHATGAFAVATVFAGVYREHRWVPWVTYGAAGLIGASRVALGRHFPSDVLVGAMLGNSMGRMVLARREESRSLISEIQPYYDPSRGEAGLHWSHAW